MLIQKHLESCYAADPVSGVLEFVEQLVDARKLKVYWDMVGKANRAIEAETGQQIQPAPGLPANAAHRNLVGTSDLHLVDQGGDWTPRTVTYGRRLSQAERDARAQPDLDYWDAVGEELAGRLADLRAAVTLVLGRRGWTLCSVSRLRRGLSGLLPGPTAWSCRWAWLRMRLPNPNLSQKR